MPLPPGTPAPDFRLSRADGTAFTREDLAGRTTVLVFYPNAFSPVCSDQFSAYEEAIGDLHAEGVEMYGVSTDQTWSQTAFCEKLGTTIEQLSDHEPKGAASRAFDAYFEPAGFSDRAIVIVGPDQVIDWSWVAENPGVLPGINVVFDGLRAARDDAPPSA